MPRRHPLAALSGLALVLCGCASIGDPFPPSLNVPVRIGDLRAFQRAASVIIDLTAPGKTTDGTALKRLRDLDVRIGPEGSDWEARARRVGTSASAEPGEHVHLTVPSEQWVNQDVAVRARAEGRGGRFGQWSAPFRLKILPPIPEPQVKAEPAPNGVRLSWNAASGIDYRVFRLAPGEAKPVEYATAKTGEYIDARAQFGATYEYSVQGFLKSGDSEVQSEMSKPVSITPQDVFPPAVPEGVGAVAGLSSIDLSWTPDTEPDLRGYYVYRSEAGGPFVRQGDVVQTPSWSDHSVRSGAQYRYEVSAVDQKGNESRPSAPVEVTAP